MFDDMNRWTEIRLAVLSGRMSIREAAKKYDLNWRTIRKTLEHVEPPGYRRRVEREKKVLGPFVPIIHEILESDKTKPKKQCHTGKRIFDRLCKEHGYQGGITVVRDEIRRWRQTRAEVFMPLYHPPGTAQFDFGEAKAIYRGREIKVMFCVMSLPYSDAFFCQAFPSECTETFQEGHVRAFEFFGGVPDRSSSMASDTRRNVQRMSLTVSLLRRSTLSLYSRYPPSKDRASSAFFYSRESSLSWLVVEVLSPVGNTCPR